MSHWSERYDTMAAAVSEDHSHRMLATYYLLSDYPKDSVWSINAMKLCSGLSVNMLSICYSR